MKLRNLIVLFVASVLFVGCAAPRGNQAVPSSVIAIPTPAGVAKLTLPKDQAIESFTYQREGTNVTVKITGVKSSNNPDVIGSGYAGALAALQAQNARLEQYLGTVVWMGNKAGNYFGLPTTPTPTNAP